MLTGTAGCLARPTRTMLSRPVTNLLLLCAAAVLLFEEWFWERSTGLFARLGRWPGFARAEAWARRRPRGQALALFAIPIAVVYPCKVLAVLAVGAGYITGGVLAFVVAKLVATALFARVYQLTEPAILQYRCLRRGRDAFLRVRRYLHCWLNRRPFYRRARDRIRGESARMARRYRAVYRLQQQRRGYPRDYPSKPAVTTSTSAAP
jgi:hypothetical protein